MQHPVTKVNPAAISVPARLEGTMKQFDILGASALGEGDKDLSPNDLVELIKLEGIIKSVMSKYNSALENNVLPHCTPEEMQVIVINAGMVLSNARSRIAAQKVRDKRYAEELGTLKKQKIDAEIGSDAVCNSGLLEVLANSGYLTLSEPPPNQDKGDKVKKSPPWKNLDTQPT